MKRQIRSSVFETNSSSTHSIAIPKKPVVAGEYISFSIGEFGGENDCVDTANYLYTAILEQDDRNELLDKLKDILNNHSIKYKFEKPKYKKSNDGKYIWLSFDCGYIDHANETRKFVLAVLNDEDLLIRYLFGDSAVYTGNDNQDDDPGGCNIANEYCWTEDEHEEYVEVPNPYHDSENYDYFYKGN